TPDHDPGPPTFSSAGSSSESYPTGPQTPTSDQESESYQAPDLYRAPDPHPATGAADGPGSYPTPPSFQSPTTAEQPSTPPEDSTGVGAIDDDDTAYQYLSYPDSDAEENPRPLYRDEVSGDDRTRVQRAAVPPSRHHAAADPDDEVLDDLGDIEEEPRQLGQRGRMALLIGAVAAVVVLGLAIGYSVLARPNGPSAGATPSPAASESATTGTPGQVSGELLGTEMLVAAADAKPIDSARTWKVSRTVTKIDETAPQAICLGGSIDGLPTAREAMMQLLESDGKEPPAVLHQASAYGTPEEAAQAYALIAKAVGNCTVDGQHAWLYSARAVSGLGDQSLGVVVEVVTGEETEYRTLILSRTGRVLNVLDVARQKESVQVAASVRTLAAAVNRQCTTAGGNCAKKTADKAGPPPVGDQPGYLSGGDLPAPSGEAGAWYADEPQNMTEAQHGSGCETADLSKVSGGRAVSRTFLVEGDAGDFGLDQYVVSMKSAKEAEKLAKKFRDDWEDCRERKVTPTVEDPAKIKGVGAKNAKITGWVSLIKVPTNESESRTYRVGVAWVGSKLIFTFLSPTEDLDISANDWKRVTVRAAERATQVN
ncbi:MAG TPA: hypothetical protein VK020_06985, partial [Microlunatus sp.]|nr:hypothetical protein [Microlunatus sp.]